MESKLNNASFGEGDVLVQYSNNKIYAVGRKITSVFVIMNTELNIVKKVDAAELDFAHYSHERICTLIVNEKYAIIANSHQAVLFDSDGNRLQVQC